MGVMQQISLPFRIALGGMAALALIWFAVLRPKPAAEPAPVAPGVAGLTNSVDAAKSAVDTANSSAAATTPASKSGTGTSTTKSTAKATHAKPVPGSLASFVAGAGPAKSLVRDLADNKVVVMVFKNESSDSGAVVRAARSVAHQVGRKMRLRVTKIGNVGKYAVFTEKTPIAQAPTTLIIGPKRNARVIVGYTTNGEITQAISDVRRQGKSIK